MDDHDSMTVLGIGLGRIGSSNFYTCVLRCGIKLVLRHLKDAYGDVVWQGAIIGPTGCVDCLYVTAEYALPQEALLAAVSIIADVGIVTDGVWLPFFQELYEVLNSNYVVERALGRGLEAPHILASGVYRGSSTLVPDPPTEVM